MSKSKSEFPHIRAYAYELIAYPDNDKLCNIIKSFNAISLQMDVESYFMILHDRDRFDLDDLENYVENHNGLEPSWNLGDEKKLHYHIYFTFKSQRWYRAIFKLLHLEPNMKPLLKVVRSITGAIKYCSHCEYPNKAQYSASDIVTNNPDMVDMVYNNILTEDNKKNDKLKIQFSLFNEWIFSHILEKEYIVHPTESLAFFVEHGCSYLYRTYSRYLNDIIIDTNHKITALRKNDKEFRDNLENARQNQEELIFFSKIGD